jgi:hypothetical protein
MKKLTSTKEFLKVTYEIMSFQDKNSKQARPHILCEDGYRISIQADDYCYCSPQRLLDDGNYDCVELGYPSMFDDLIEQYRQGVIYPNVPIGIVDELLKKHGGISKMLKKTKRI